MTNRKTTRKYITRELVWSCLPDKNFSEPPGLFLPKGLRDNIEQCIGKPLTHKQIEQIHSLYCGLFLIKLGLSRELAFL